MRGSIDMTTVLVTGSDGFIGSNLVKKLLESGRTVYGISLADQTDITHEKFTYSSIDILDCDAIDTLFSSVRFDSVVHLAALTTHDEMVNRKARTLRINLDGVLNVLSAARESAVRKIVYASTGKVYGSIESLPISETHPARPTNILGKTKLIAEQLFDFFADDAPFESVILRIFNVYGPGQRDYFLVPTIVSQLQSGNDSIVLGNITDRRDYVYIDDVVDAIMHVLATPFDTPLVHLNVGTGRSYCARDIVDQIGMILNRDINIVTDQKRFRKDEFPDEYADITRLKNIGWNPNYSLCEGLRKTVQAYGL